MTNEKPLTQSEWIEYAKQKKGQNDKEIPMPPKPESKPEPLTGASALEMMETILNEEDNMTPANLIYKVLEVVDKVRADEFRRERLYLARIQRLEEYVKEIMETFNNDVQVFMNIKERLSAVENLLEINDPEEAFRSLQESK
jgi:hypothetical protein